MAKNRDKISRDAAVNRDIDTDTAEGHRKALIEDSGDAALKSRLRPADGLDDEAEGHRVWI